jgi:hypothetical protein
MYICDAFVEDQLTVDVWIYFWVLYSVPLVCVGRLGFVLFFVLSFRELGKCSAAWDMPPAHFGLVVV